MMSIIAQLIRACGVAMAAIGTVVSLFGLFAIQGLGSQPAWEQALAIGTVLMLAFSSPLVLYGFIKRQELQIVASVVAAAVVLVLANAVLLQLGVLNGEALISLLLICPHLLFLLWLALPSSRGPASAAPPQ